MVDLINNNSNEIYNIIKANKNKFGGKEERAICKHTDEPKKNRQKEQR